MDTTRRAAGLGLAGYGLGTAVAFMSTNSPGGSYEAAKVTAYMDTGRWPVASALGYLGAFAALAFLVFAVRMKDELGSRGELFWALSIAGVAAGVVGWFLVTGIPIAFGEGGTAVTAMAHPAVYLISELSNLVAICASAFFIGTAAIVLASRAALPRPVRVMTYVAGLCGILAPFWFPLFLFWLWTVGVGAWLAVSDVRVPEEQLAYR
ncbi:MAG: hypothetical protein QOI82_1047 [Actinomycetota bacterium]|jgi:hypothetical protein|nr:hypothetical protein [Actinomycetota bacterium]